MARGTGSQNQECAQARGTEEVAAPPDWPSHHKPLAPGDPVIYYRASEKDRRGMGHTQTRHGAVLELSVDEKGILVTIADADGSKVRVRLHQVAKLNLDGSNPGLPWTHYPNGQTSKDEDHCQEWVHSGARWDFRGHQCTFKRKGESLFCGRHAHRAA
jgi:hypothetical protein